MTIGIIGRKRGMTRIFTEDGHSIPVTVIEAGINRVTRLTSLLKRMDIKLCKLHGAVRNLAKQIKLLPVVYAKANIDLGEGTC